MQTLEDVDFRFNYELIDHEQDDKGVIFTMHLKKGPTALHTWFKGKDNTMLSAYYVYVSPKNGVQAK